MLPTALGEVYDYDETRASLFETKQLERLSVKERSDKAAGCETVYQITIVRSSLLPELQEPLPFALILNPPPFYTVSCN